MMTAQFDDDGGGGDVSRTNSSSSLTANDACHRITST